MAEASLACLMIEKALEKYAPELCDCVLVKSFSEGVAKIIFENASASAEFQSKADKILEEVNKKLGSEKIQRFTYKIS